MKPPYKQLLGIAVLLLILGGLSMFELNKKPKILETKTFSCPGMEGFSFEYPVFEGWELLKNGESRPDNPDECIIDLNNPVPYSADPNRLLKVVAPRIIISKSFMDGSRNVPSTMNPQGIFYEDYTNVKPKQGEALNLDRVNFYGSGFVISVELRDTNENYGFSKDKFFKTVIESFRLVPEIREEWFYLINNQAVLEPEFNMFKATLQISDTFKEDQILAPTDAKGEHLPGGTARAYDAISASTGKKYTYTETKYENGQMVYEIREVN